MQIEIYADVIFFINFIMDFFIFWIVSKLIKKKISFLRLILGAVTASLLYCLLIFIAPLRDIYNIFAVTAVLMISIMICFRPSGLKEFIKLIFLTNVSAFSVGGAGIALFYYTNIADIMGNMLGFTIHNFSLKLLIISSSITYIILKFVIKWYRRTFIQKQTFYNLKIYYEGNDIELNALVDTGNSLHEPITNTPVIIAEFLAVKKFLPDNIKLIYTQNDENNLARIINCLSESEYAGKIRMIPYSSLGKKNGILIGFKADKIEILGEKKVLINNAIIAIYNFKLSKDGFYNALLNPEVLENVI